MDVAAALTSAGIGGAVSLATSLLTVRATERRLRAEFQLQYAAERVVHELLQDARWTLRSFDVIRRHIGGFEDEDLRRVLVRSGAIRFESKSGGELWGLLDRNRAKLGVVRLDEDPDLAPTPGRVTQG
jgi:hypothetical protein